MSKGFQKGNKYRFVNGNIGFKGPHSEKTKQLIREKRKLQINTSKGKHWKVKDSSKMGKGMLGKIGATFGKRWKVKDTSKYKGSKKGRHWKVKDTSNMQNRKVSDATRQKLREKRINNPIKKFSNTKIEIKIKEELEKRGFIANKDFFQNKGIRNITNVDFYLPDYNIVIECDGCYYHCCLQCGFIKHHKFRRINDFRNKILLQEINIKMYRFWEHDINTSPEECLNQIFNDQ